jgi:hypothetical protein
VSEPKEEKVTAVAEVRCGGGGGLMGSVAMEKVSRLGF